MHVKMCVQWVISPSPLFQVNTFCKMLSDFAMEYRTTYDKVQAKRERIKHEKEREKKRGKLIVSAPPLSRGCSSQCMISVTVVLSLATTGVQCL